MTEIRLAGQVAPAVLRRLPRLRSAVVAGPGVYFVFAHRQDRELPRSTVLQDATGNTYRLLAITQQFDMLVEVIDPGWKVILALQASKADALAALPVVEEWYSRPYEEAFVLTVLK